MPPLSMRRTMADTIEQPATNNPVLQDIVDIKIARPELTAEQWEIVEKASPYYKALLKPEVRQDMELEYSSKYDAFVAEARANTQAAVQAKFEEWKKAQEPLNTEELKKLISQEYEDIDVPVKVRDEVKHFTIRELPKSVEKRFVAVAQKALLPLLQEKALAEFKWDFSDSMASKITSILNLIPNGLDVLADLCAVCLDPFEKNKEINGTWVSDNISSSKIQAIVLLQFEVNKYRDFFLSAFRLFQNLSNRSMM